MRILPDVDTLHLEAEQSFWQLVFDWETPPPAEIRSTPTPRRAIPAPRLQPASKTQRSKPRPKRSDKAKTLGGRKQRRTMVHVAQAITPAMLTGHGWQNSAACATSPLNFVHADPATVTPAMALCGRCPVLWDCLNAQHRSHPRARSVGVVAGSWWAWAANGKQITVGAAQDSIGPFCPHCNTRFDNPRAMTVHAQRCAEAWASKLLRRIDAIHRATPKPKERNHDNQPRTAVIS